MDKIISTLISIVVAVGGSAVLFIGANKLFDLAKTKWQVFTATAGGVLAFTSSLLLWANNIYSVAEGPFVGKPNPTGFNAVGDMIVQIFLNTIIPTVIGAVGGWLIGSVAEGQEPRKLVTSVATGGLLGLFVGIFFEEPVAPEVDIVSVLVWTVVGVAIGFGWWSLRKKGAQLSVVALWAALGWIFGAFLAPTLGAGNAGWTIVAATVAGAGLGAWVGFKPVPDYPTRDMVSQKSRVYIFLAPALTFIAASLLFPTLRTIYLSFLGPDPELPFAERAPGGVDKFIGLENYGAIFANPKSFDVSGWAEIFGSRLFWIGMVLIAGGWIVGAYLGRQRGHRFEGTGGSLAPMSVGVFLLAFAVFAALRGTIFNNLWWVFAVTILATTLGLAIAVLADRARFESVAKSLIFMPMAISFVGAGIIWRFMYDARDVSQDQTGVLNSIWVGLGQLSNSGWPKALAAIVLALIILGLAYMAYKGYQANAMGLLAGSVVTALPFLWILIRLLTTGIGGFRIEDGEVIQEIILVRENSPFNNVFLMVVLIWIQTGFTMVIFSAAIKAVPSELLEAARVDGATESQSFWRITIPQIAPTIGVVVTTLIVLVMKVFDIVKVMTNGNFDTQVLANEMFTTAFTEFNFGEGSALAVLLFLSVLPVMYVNIRRMQEA